MKNYNVENELNYLVLDYNTKRNKLKKVHITGVSDVDHNILKNLDIKSLNRICTSSKYANKLCDKNFWIDKIKYDDLPLFLLNIYPQTYNTWLNTYNSLLIVKNRAINKLLVNNIEATRSYLPTQGIIKLDILEPEIFNTILPDYNIDLTIRIIRIVIQSNNNNYIVTIQPVVNKNFTTINTISMSYEQVLDIMMKAEYNNIFLRTRAVVGITDEDNIVFIITPNIINNMIVRNPDNFSIHRDKIYRRLSIWDSINFLNKENSIIF